MEKSFVKFYAETFIGYVKNLKDKADEEYLMQQAVDEINNGLCMENGE